MFLHNEDNVQVVDSIFSKVNSLQKSGSVSPFDEVQLSCLKNVIEDWKEQVDNSYAIIKCINGIKDVNGSHPTYVTVCAKPHWSTEGVLASTNIFSATKFEPTSEDMFNILNHLHKHSKNKQYTIVYINKDVFPVPVQEVWSNAKVRGDWKPYSD